MYYLFAKFLLNFCGSATFRNREKGKKMFTTDFCSPKVKHTYSRKGFNTPKPKDSLQIFALQFIREIKLMENFDLNVYFLFASCFNNKVSFNI